MMTASEHPAPRGLSRRVRAVMWGGFAALLLLPAIAMQFTREVDWGPEDFAFAAVAFGLTGLATELAARVIVSWPARIAAIVAIFAVLGVVWVELAVGILD